MKNIITILLIIILPVAIYLFLNKNSTDKAAIAIANEKPIMMIFTSNMCASCKQVKSIVSEIEENYNDKINIVSINALENSKATKDKIKRYGVVLVPTLVFTDNDGKLTNKMEGDITKDELVKSIEDAING